jgi:hypothetical protein
MKTYLKISLFSILFIGAFSSCKKVAGPGGTSAIRGSVIGVNNSTGESEIIDITVKQGNDIEHGDYFLFNGPSGGTLYYVWYNNPTWVSNGDPQLQGRIGIQVNFNYSDSNLEIANATFTAIDAELNGDFTISQNNDILTLVSSTHAEISDADNGTTNFNVDVTNQGSPDVTGTEMAITEERVYLIYGDGTVFNDIARTGADGTFTFEGLQIGKYKLYALSKNAITGEMVPVYKEVEITEKASINEVGVISIVQ